MPPMEWIWLAAIVVFAVAEASTSALVSLWFIGGSVAALIAALCHAPLWLQFVLFVAVSALLLFALRPLVRSRLNRRITPTNAERNVGQIAIVTEAIDNVLGTGAVTVGGKVWTARTEEPDGKAETGKVMTVVRIDGVKLIVK